MEEEAEVFAITHFREMLSPGSLFVLPSISVLINRGNMQSLPNFVNKNLSKYADIYHVVTSTYSITSYVFECFDFFHIKLRTFAT